MPMTTSVKRRRTGTEDRILSAASDLFYENGLRGVAVDDVIAESGVAKSTLYAHYPTKDDLVAAYLRQTDVSWLAQLRKAGEAAGEAAADQLVGLFDALGDAFDRHGFFGCPFISASVEAALDSKARAATVAHVEHRQAWLTDLAGQSGAADPEGLAHGIGLLIDGALASGRLLQDRVVVTEAKAGARRLVEAHSTSSERSQS
jgi:AcrR family transcriptional regulator